MQHRTLQKNGNWYKGNLHLHTTMSDGKLDPADAIAIYRDAGYHFLAVTDHNVYGLHTEEQSANFLIFGAVETNTSGSPQLTVSAPTRGWSCHHVVFIADPATTPYKHGDCLRANTTRPMQDVIDDMTSCGHLAIYAHPRWSHVQMDDFLALRGCIGMEIYNHVSQMVNHCGTSESYYEHALWNGQKIMAFASDDAHYGSGTLGAYINIKARELTHASILDAIKQGSFYASNGGPDLLDFYVEDGVVHIKCAPAKHITVFGNGIVGYDHIAGFDCHQHERPTPNNEFLTELTWDSKKAWLVNEPRCFYVMLTDNHGKKTWSNPVWL